MHNNVLLKHFALLGHLFGCYFAIVNRYNNLFNNKSNKKSYSAWCKDNLVSLNNYFNNVFSDSGLPISITQSLAFIVCLLYNLCYPVYLIFKINMEIACCLFYAFLMANGIECIDQCSYYSDLFTLDHYGADRDLRCLFDIKRLTIFDPSRHHTHGLSAAERTGASRTLSETIQNAGYDPYVVSMASTDQLHGLAGNRFFYWSKDFKPDYQSDPITENSAFMMVDVDYYCDMTAYLKYFKPILMYTLQPNNVSYRSKEYAYYIKDNEVHYDVSGAGRYHHKIWDYDSDTIQVVDDLGYLCVFHVVSKTIDNPKLPQSGRRVVSLMPLRRIAPFCYRTPGFQLKRKQYTYNNVNIIHDYVKGVVSMAANGAYEAVSMTTLEFTALQTVADRKEKALAKGDVQSLLRRRYAPGESPPYQEFELQTPIIAHLMSLTLDLPINCVATTSIPVRRETPPVSQITRPPQAFTALGPDTINENKFPGQIITSQLASTSAVLPAKNNNNSCASIKGRLTDLVNRAIPERKIGSYADEFVKLIVPESIAHKGMPIDLEEVRKKQTRPLQKARIEATRHTQGVDPDNRLVTFIKNEPYAATNHPRNITTMAPEFTLALSAWTYAFKEDCLKCLDSYGPGKTPLETCSLLKTICSDGAILTDYSRYDGSISQWLQENIVKRCYKRWACDPAFISGLIDKIFKQSGTTSEGVKYASYYGTRSGSPTTTDGNTLINMFVVYAALRKLGHSKTQALALLGIYAGDDGVSRNITGLAESIEDVAMHLGLKLKSQVTLPGEPINYLGRIFPDILTTISSHQDIERTLPKLHISTNQVVTKEQAAYNKAAGYLVTDKLTPILGDWARVVCEITNCGQVRNELREETYRRENEAWPQLIADRTLLRSSVANQLNMNIYEVQLWEMEIRETTSLSEFPVVWMNEPDDKIDALVGDQVILVGSGDSVISETQLINNGRTSTSTDPIRISGECPSTSTAPINGATHEGPPKNRRVETAIPARIQPVVEGAIKRTHPGQIQTGIHRRPTTNPRPQSSGNKLPHEGRVHRTPSKRRPSPAPPHRRPRTV